MKEKLRKMQFGWGLIVIVGVLLIGVFIYGIAKNGRDLHRANSDEANLAYTLSKKQETQIGLQTELDNIGSKSYIENRARAELGYVKEGELRFRVVNADQLDSYTEQEWQIVLNEMAFDN